MGSATISIMSRILKELKRVTQNTSTIRMCQYMSHNGCPLLAMLGNHYVAMFFPVGSGTQAKVVSLWVVQTITRIHGIAQECFPVGSGTRLVQWSRPTMPF